MASYGIGAIIRAERIRQGLSIDTIARKSKISPRFLDAIEEEDFDSLPGLVFARGFIRQYANLLKLDSESILASLPKVGADAAVPEPEPPRKEQSASYGGSWDPRGNSAAASALWIGLALAAGLGGYLYFNRSASSTASASRTSDQKPGASSSTGASALAPAPANAGSSSIKPVSATVSPASAKPVQVTLIASEPAWVSITADGRNAFTGILKADEKKVVDADGLVKLVAGNAGGLKVSLNGKELDALGPRGQVRTVRFTADGPQFVLKTPGAPPLDPL